MLHTAEQKLAARTCRQLNRKVARAVASGNEARVQAALDELNRANAYFISLMRSEAPRRPYVGP